MQNVDEEVNFDVSESVVIVGFGQMGQVTKVLSFSISFLEKGKFGLSKWFHIEFAGVGQLFVNAIGLRSR